MACVARAANTGELKELRRESRGLIKVVTEQALALRLLKLACSGIGATTNGVRCLSSATVEASASKDGFDEWALKIAH